MLPNTDKTSVLPKQTSTTRVMGVEYLHLTFENGDDLYVSPDGLPFLDHLAPRDYWRDKAWFRAHSERLSGTSVLYRICTPPRDGRSLDIVLKWNRMGQDIPGETMANELANAEFNSPFEEFSLVAELRKSGDGSPKRVLTHKPLAIYVPRGHSDLDQLGRRQYKIDAKKDGHTEVDLDIHRRYAVIYEWIKGIDAAAAMKAGLLDVAGLTSLKQRVERDMARKGFLVHDSKAQHIIVRPNGDGRLSCDRSGKALYASIDFELLARTPEREAAVRAQKRKAYLVKQARRFEAESEFPSHLRRVSVLGVDYVYGRTESTHGALWVVGKDPALFDYFLPEKWRRTSRKKLSVANQIYETVTKDNVHLVWKVSRVGEQPDMDPFKADEKRILDHGYNSPFEEVSLNLRLSRSGIETTYPRAVYMTGESSGISDFLSDERRYVDHASLKTPEGQPILQRNHVYIIIFGYWNGPDELLAQRDQDYVRGVSALAAYREGLIDETVYLRLMQRTRDRLIAVGTEDLNLRGNHLLLSVGQDGSLVVDPDGLPAVRICNFELLRRVSDPQGTG
jgi:hypothetical protein